MKINKVNIDLVRAIMQVEGDFNITGTHYENGEVEFSGYKKIDGKIRNIIITMDKNWVELISECDSVMEVVDCYKKEVGEKMIRFGDSLKANGQIGGEEDD